MHDFTGGQQSQYTDRAGTSIGNTGQGSHNGAPHVLGDVVFFSANTSE